MCLNHETEREREKDRGRQSEREKEREREREREEKDHVFGLVDTKKSSYGITESTSILCIFIGISLYALVCECIA
jgi:hypothetical protein